MKYPIITLNDETEITASNLTENGKIFVYIEKWNASLDDFNYFEIILPDNFITKQNGYTEVEIEKLKNHIISLQKDIFDYVQEKEEEEKCRV